MTEDSDFRRTFEAFRAMPYPSRPQSEEFQDWGSELLSLDSHVAGYATRVHDGNMVASDIPNLKELVCEVRDLQSSLASVPVLTSRDSRLRGEYQLYVETLESMMRELLRLATD